ncbi:hypothetical protein DY000_02062011 [Brassica cretica]|uniref:DUF4005 domain-containing protein n=1 Tax=Brassica cretica TaxID=69181 RepID=A0ABQ7AWW6_BRACR|nr:hypothetical protein DY000_02062011 [Brassica cretica]
MATFIPLGPLTGCNITELTLPVTTTFFLFPVHVIHREMKRDNNKSGNIVTTHCPQKKRQEVPVKRTRRGRSKDKQKWIVVDATADIATKSQPQDQTGVFHQVQYEPPKSPPAASHSTRSKMELIAKSKLGTEKDKAVGESSGTPSYLQPMLTRSRSGSGISRSSQSEVQPDSSDIESSDPEKPCGTIYVYAR